MVLAHVNVRCATLQVEALKFVINGCIKSYDNELRLSVQSVSLYTRAEGGVGNSEETHRLFISVKIGILENLGRIYAQDYIEMYCHNVCGISDSRDPCRHLHDTRRYFIGLNSGSSFLDLWIKLVAGILCLKLLLLVMIVMYFILI